MDAVLKIHLHTYKGILFKISSYSFWFHQGESPHWHYQIFKIFPAYSDLF